MSVYDFDKYHIKNLGNGKSCLFKGIQVEQGIPIKGFLPTYFVDMDYALHFLSLFSRADIGILEKKAR